MPASTLKELLAIETEDDVLTFLLTQLGSLGFPVTRWASGGRLYTALRAFARGLSDVSSTVYTITSGGLLGLSTGAWLTLLAKEIYSIDRLLATFAKGTLRLTVATGAGPYTITPGASIAKETVTGLRYFSTNTSNVVLPAGPSNTTVEYKAESPGSKYNVPIGNPIEFVTPLPGVSGVFYDSMSLGTWLTQQGTDDEKDEVLRTRCRTKWATIGLQKTADAYLFLAADTPGIGTPVTKVLVDGSNPYGPGTIAIWLAGAAGPLPTADRDLVRAYLASLKSVTADLGVGNAYIDNAPTLAITITATVYYKGEFVTALADAQTALQQTIQDFPIGGNPSTNAALARKLLLSQVVEDIMTIPGVVNVPVSSVLLNGVNADLVFAANQVGVLSSFTPTGIVI